MKYLKMKSVVLLKLVLLMCDNALGKSSSKGWISIPENKTYIGNDDLVPREDFRMTLESQLAKPVVNPSESFSPLEFAAVIYRKDVLIGSGAIITKHYVLTLYTLLKPPNGEKIDLAPLTHVKFPTFNSKQLREIVKTVSASHLSTHPECVQERLNPVRNIGLIKTKEVIEHVRFPKLPSVHIPEDKSRFIISNFRVLNHAATDITTAMWYMFTRKVDSAICAHLFKADENAFSAEGNICVSYFHLGDAKNCQGDTGSPLSIRYQNEDTLVGLNMHKHDCGSPRGVASYVCVKKNLEWINKVIKS